MPKYSSSTFDVLRLEPRRHLAADYAVLTGSTLVITGTAGNDWALVIERKGTYRAFLNDGSVSVKFPVSSVSLVIARLGDGDDLFGTLPAALPAKIFGENGDDALFGGGGNDRLEGGPGNDSLYGGYGNDRLYGNEGNDLLYGYGGRDSLYGGAGVDTNYALDSRDPVVMDLELLR